MTDSQLDELFVIVKEEGVDEMMIKYQDTDRPSKFVKEMLGNERLLGWIQGILDVGKNVTW